MAKTKTYDELDSLISATGLKYSAIATKIGKSVSTLYSWRKRPDLMDSNDILVLSKATGIDDKKISNISLNFARKLTTYD